MSYETLHLDPGEKVILEVRKHWIVFAAHASGLLFAAFLPFVLFALIKKFLPGLISISLPGNQSALFLYFYSLWLLALWISFFVDWTKYYLDVWYVTEKRIIIIDQKQLFNREMSNVRFDKIQDISVEVPGFLSTLLDFGDIKVQTASEDICEFKMRVIRHPGVVRQIIFSQHNEIGDKNSSQSEGV